LTGAAPFPQPAREGAHELTNLEERLGLLLMVRIGMVAFVVLTALFASKQVGFGISNIGPISAAYITIVATAEGYRRRGRRGRLTLHRVVLPLDAVYLAMVTAPSGGPRSQLVVLFAVQLIAVTLLVSERAGLRMALWDSFLFILIPTLSLSSRIGSVLGLHFVTAPPASETALAIMGFWAVALCTAFFSSVSERELRRSKSELSELAAMAAEMELLHAEEEIFSILLRTVVRAFGFRRAALWWVRGNRPRGLVLNPGSEETTSVSIPETARHDRVAASVWDSRNPILVKHLSLDDDPVAAGMMPHSRNVVVLPIQLEGGDLGVVLLEHGGHPFTSRLPKRVLLMLGQFIAHAALSVRNARLLDERERLATIDGLTGVSNRRHFDHVLSSEVSRAERSGESFALVIFDLDHFKVVNDTQGHLAGDEVLKAFAKVLSNAVREMDLVARYGGEEFALILPRCDQHGAVAVVERVNRGLRICEPMQGVTVSAGVASLPSNAKSGRDLIDAADEALFESKRSGRDRWTLSTRRTNGERLTNHA
jgi:two-component system cell cycle response regulator